MLARGVSDQFGPFARRHRVMPLMTAVGVADGTPPGRYSIGLFGHPIVHVDEVGYWLWFWGHLSDNLWLASTALAEARRAAGSGDAEPETCLTLVLTGLHQLLSSSAAYLDASWDGRQGSG